jgi:uncharacterized membrane protein YccC
MLSGGLRPPGVGHDAAVSSAAAELSSVATVLEELVRRVTAIADAYAGARRDDLANELYRVEQALTAARRGLARVVDAEGTGGG